MSLLSRLFVHPLDYSGHFGDTKPDTVWRELYAVRSSLAHGSNPDFAREFSTLKSIDTVDRFVQSAVGRVMRDALDEPQLIADLRNCSRL
jgi:hypothetical protein